MSDEFERGQHAFRTRCNAIVNSAEGQAHTSFATYLAMETDLPAEKAIKLMKIAAGDDAGNPYKRLASNPAAAVLKASALAGGRRS
jgi:hypothetical protein